ncbi:MAG: pyridoxal phosphate enzyme (YggS family), partial [Bacteroidia bacterium]
MIQQNINRIKEELGETTLVAVSKFRSLTELEALYQTGQRIFGENRVQELLQKQSELNTDILWHLIGHLQTNKVKSVIGKVDLIHSVDSVKLLKEIQKQSKKQNLITRVLLQIHVADEESKFGFKPDELIEFVKGVNLTAFDQIAFCGIMSMATLTSNSQKIEEEFGKTVETFKLLKPLVPNS